MRGAFASFLALFLFHFPSLKEWHWRVGKISLLLHKDLEMVASLLVEAHLLEVSGIFVRFPVLVDLGFVQTQMGSPSSGVERTVFVCRSVVGLEAFLGMPLCYLLSMDLFSLHTVCRFFFQTYRY
jgi:hypothetical protein